ncbi:MAG: regulatory signaling modulator protein AmpE, partial [Gammaproteobacteria bacterium]|nr:regulatory signaling modulator protein AmpE [Gammaproteobacteria bacterium]
MTLIALLTCLALEMFWQRADEYRRLDWLNQYTDWMLGRLEKASWRDGAAGLVTVLLVPMLVVGTAQSVLAGVWLGLLELIFGIVVLIYCLRFQSLDRLVDEYYEARGTEDEVRTESIAIELTGESSISNDDVVKAVLVQSNERLFSVVFWFILLGPLG